ncbi:MAG: IS4 family transposase [Leptolyngbya sp. BL-A-14]
MSQYSELKRVLQAQLNWHGARLSFLALFLLALLKVKTVNLSDLCLGLGGRALPQSSYKRLQRFFREFELDYAQLAHLVVGWMQIPSGWVLSLDRTTWKFGSHWHNILTLGIVHEGVAFPVLWWLLDKQGNSHSDERMRFIETFHKRFPTAVVEYLCADREFIGQAWVRYLLLEPALAFRLRIRSTDPIEHDGKVLPARVVFAHLQVGQAQRLTGTCRVWGYPVAVEALRLEDGELLVVIAPVGAQAVVKDYALRWGIETLFGIFKTRGFCLESTHFTDAERLSKLFALLTLALCWAMRTGLWLQQWQPIALKKHGRRAKSLFRFGLDFLRHLVLNPSVVNESNFVQSLQLLSCT